MKPLLVLLLAGGALWGRPMGLTKGFVHFFNLEYTEAIAEFEREVAAHPADPEAHNHLAQGILYRELFRAGALETELVSRNNPFLRRANMNTPPEMVRDFDSHIATSMRLCEERIRENPKDGAALYAYGVAYGLRANFNFLIRRAWMDALKDATNARKLHNQVTALEPDNIDAKLVQGLHDYLVGSLPWHYKVLGFLTGIRGDRESGIRTLEIVAEKGRLNRYDARVLLAAVYRREEQPRLALPLLSELIEAFPRNYLFRLELALMHQDLGENERAIAILNEVERLKRRNAQGFRTLPVEKIAFYKGTVYFWAAERDEALEEFRRAAAKPHELDLNSEVLTFMRIGQIHDLRGERQLALAAYRKAVELAPSSGPGRESRGYLSSPYKGKS